VSPLGIGTQANWDALEIVDQVLDRDSSTHKNRRPTQDFGVAVNDVLTRHDHSVT
jgi:hypothetical protein